MKKLLRFLLICIILLGICYLFKDQITEFIINSFKESIDISELDPNEYYRPYDYGYVQITNDFDIKNHQQLLNAYYTIVNSGADEFTFKCDYDKCLDDVETVSNSQKILSSINSFVHPYNSFTSVETKYTNLGRVVVTVNKTYTSTDITEINNKLNYIYSNVIKDEKNTRNIIKLAHDYIINNTKYDTDRSDLQIVNYKSDTAYGPLLQGYSLCGGYTDAMALVLDHYNIRNIKIMSENHIWNGVNINDKWLHLDLTWDDPVASNGKDILDHKFFLITSDTLSKTEGSQHIYDKDIFKEMA